MLGITGTTTPVITISRTLARPAHPPTSDSPESRSNRGAPSCDVSQSPGTYWGRRGSHSGADGGSATFAARLSLRLVVAGDGPLTTRATALGVPVTVLPFPTI